MLPAPGSLGATQLSPDRALREGGTTVRREWPRWCDGGSGSEDTAKPQGGRPRLPRHRSERSM